MLIIENLFCIFLIFHLSRGMTDTGMKKEMKNYIGNSVISLSTKTAHRNLSKGQDLYNDEPNDVTDGNQQDDGSVIEKNKLKKIKDYHNNNNNFNSDTSNNLNNNAVNNNNNFNSNVDNSNNNNNNNNHQYYRKNSFQNNVRKYIKHDNIINNNSNYDKYDKENNFDGDKELTAKTKQNDKFSSNHNNYNNENGQFKTMDKSSINAYKNKYTSGNKKITSNKNDLLPNTHRVDSLHHFSINNNNNKNKNKSQHTGTSSSDEFYSPFLSDKPLAHEFSFFVNKIFKLNPFVNPLLMSTDFEKSNKHHNYSEFNKFINEDKIQQLKNEIGERIKLHSPLYTGSMKELDRLENKLNSPVLQEDSLIDNVINVQNFISNIMKNSPGKSLRNNFDGDTIVNEQDLIKNHSSFKMSPSRYYNSNNNFLISNLKNESENYTESKNILDMGENNYPINNFDVKNLSNYLSFNNELNNKNKNLKQINTASDTDELVNRDILNSSFYRNNKNFSPNFLPHLPNDHLGEVNNKAGDLSQINRNDDFYYQGISNSFDGRHLNLVPSSILMKNLNKRDLSIPAPEPVWNSHDFDSNNNNYKRPVEKYSHKNKKGKKARLKTTVTDKTTVEAMLINKFGDDTDVDKLCRTYKPKKHPTTTKDESSETIEEETTTTTCEPTTTTCEPTAITYETTTCESSTEFAITSCETPTTPTTTCETVTEPPTTSCEPETDDDICDQSTCEEPTTCESPETTTTCEPSTEEETTTCEPTTTTCEPTSPPTTTTTTFEPSTTEEEEECNTPEETTPCPTTTCKPKTRRKLKTVTECASTKCETKCEFVGEAEDDESNINTTIKIETTESKESDNIDDSEDNDQNIMMEK